MSHTTVLMWGPEELIGWQEARTKQKIDAANGLVVKTFMVQGSTPSECRTQPIAQLWVLGWQTGQPFFS